MATPKKPAAEAEKTVETADQVKVEGLRAAGNGAVVAVEKTEVEPNPAPEEPEQAATPAPADQEVMANIGHLRVKTTAEKRVEDASEAVEDHWLRPAKEAHADAAKLSVLQTVGTELSVEDLRGTSVEDAVRLVRVRLLFDWLDGQGVPHERGKEMDLPRNEASKLVDEGRAERANPPDQDPVALAMAEARMAVMAEQARK